MAALILATPGLDQSISAQSPRKSRAKQPASQPRTVADSEFDRFVKLADDARLSDRLGEAISLYGQAVKIKPKWPEGGGYVGAICEQKEVYPQARAAVPSVVAVEPRNGPAGRN